MTDEHVQDFLQRNTYPAHLVNEGRAGLIRRWKKFVQQVEGGYAMDIYAYRNDLDIRSIIEKAGAVDDEVRALDARLKKLLTGSKRIWHSGLDNDFWCVGYPKNARDDLMDDLRRENVV